MRRGATRLIAALAVAMALGGCMATTDAQREGARAAAERDLAEALAGRVAGKARDCIGTIGASGPQIIGERTMLYRSGRTVWRNDLPDGCPRLDDDDLLVLDLHGGSQICRNDRFQAVARGSMIPGPTCRFGSFTPYTKR